MKDRRSVDDLSIEELERILLTKRREARLVRLRQMGHSESVAGRDPLARKARSKTILLDNASSQPNSRSLNAKLLYWLAAPLRIKWRFILDSLLLLVEIGVVIALVFIAVSSWQDRQKINKEAADLFVPPTPTTAPLIDAVVLPSGHTPPTAPGGAQPASIPEHLQHLVQQVTPLPVPTPGPEQATRIVIPAIDVDAPVVEGDDWEQLKRGAGHHIGSADPGTAGNCVVSAHNDIFGEIFRRLEDLEPGDQVFIHTVTQVYSYKVTIKQIIEPTQVEVMEPTRDPVLTLITCHPYLVNTQRVAVIAELTP